MFVIILRYVADLSLIDEALDEHVRWLDEQYSDGIFVASGRQVPRVGGVILATGISREALESRLAVDPFHRRQLAEYTVVEFTPSRVADGLERLHG